MEIVGGFVSGSPSPDVPAAVTLVIPRASRDAWLKNDGDGARAWMDGLPSLLARLLEQWDCRPAGPIQSGYGGVVQPVIRRNGSRAMLKVSYPYPGEDHESTILANWAGRGAVLMLERDDDVRARLLEELLPTSLAEVEDAEEATSVVGQLARRLAVPAPEGLPRMRDACERWEVALPVMNAAVGARISAQVIDAATSTCREFGPGQPDTLLHGDLHQSNVLRSTRQPWLVIDPTGVVGEVASECLTHIRDRARELRQGDTPERALRRLTGCFAEAAAAEPERVRRWVQLRATVTVVGSSYDGTPLADDGFHEWCATTLSS